MGDRPNVNHNVYILGAGFSSDAGLPLVNNFLERMADAVEWLYNNNRESEAEAIRSVFDFRLRAAGAAYRAEVNIDNIEELFSLASASEGETRANDVITAIAATLDFAERTTTRPTCKVQFKQQVGEESWSRRDRIDPLYQLYAGIISGSMCSAKETQNTVITLNYDTLLEDALAEIHVPFHYGLPIDITTYHHSAKCCRNEDQDSMAIYKLHGSINWTKPLTRNSKTTVFGNYSDLSESGGRVLLIPPTWRKVFAEQLVHVWEGAVDALNKATRIIVIGFSMPPTDTHFKYLIAAGLQRNISLRKFLFVNPGLAEGKGQERTRLRKNLFSILRRELESRGVVELVPINAKGFFFHRTFVRKIERDIHEDFLSIEYGMSEFHTNYISGLSTQ